MTSSQVPARPTLTPKTVIAGMTGNVLEWYDFAVYGYLAPILGRLFFPASDRLASLLAAFAVFAIGYAARPLGGVIFGHIGDRLGRKPALIISILAMGIATFTIGILPTHAAIGTAAAASLVALRLLQGISIGGEYTGSIVLIAEQSLPERRGLNATWPQVGCLMGFLLGSGIGAGVSNLLGEAAMLHGGWRVPFLLGAVIAIVGLLIRRGLSESLPPQARAVAGLSPVVLAFRDHWQTILRMMSILMVNTAGFYLLFVYAASYLTERMHMSTGRALDINTINLFVVLAAILPAAALSDRIGRKPLLYAATIGTILFGWPLWWLMHQHSFESVLLGQLGLALIFSAGLAVFPATIVEMLPPEVRVSGTSIGYNLGVGLIGGTAPLVATYLVARTGNDFAPVYYLIVFAFIQLVSLLTLPETARKPLLK